MEKEREPTRRPGRPVTHPSRAIHNVSIDADLWEWLDAEADRTGQSKSDIINAAIRAAKGAE